MKPGHPYPGILKQGKKILKKGGDKMASQKDATVIDKAKIPIGRVVGTFTFLRDMGKTLGEDKAISVKANDAVEAKKIQNRWRAYFKGEAHSRKEETPDNKFIVYLWLEKAKK